MWEISRDRLISRLKILDLVQEKVGLSSSEFFWFRGKGEQITISVASYVMGEVTLKGEGKWPSKNGFFVDRRVFMPFINASLAIKNKNTFKFTIHNKVLTVKHGSREAKFVSQRDIKGYSNLKKILKEEASEIPISDDLRELLTCGSKCAIADSIVPHLNCVFVNKGSVSVEFYASADKFYYMGIGNNVGKIKNKLPFPLRLIDLLQEKTLKNISWRGKYIILNFEKGTIWQPISEEALQDFPITNIKKYAVRGDTLPITFTASSRRLSKLMVRLGYYLQAVRRKDWLVTIHGKKGNDFILLTTDIPGVAFREIISTTDKIKKDFDLNWPLNLIEPVFTFLSTKTKNLGVVVRTDKKHGVSYVRVGAYWLAVTRKQKKESA